MTSSKPGAVGSSAKPAISFWTLVMKNTSRAAWCATLPCSRGRARRPPPWSRRVGGARRGRKSQSRPDFSWSTRSPGNTGFLRPGRRWLLSFHRHGPHAKFLAVPVRAGPIEQTGLGDSRDGWRVWPNPAHKLVPTAIDRLWIADITCVRPAEAFADLAVIVDAFNRRVIGPPGSAGLRWPLQDHLRAELALEALHQALASRAIIAGCLAHQSDRGTQGGLKRSSQQPDVGGCDDEKQAARHPAEHEPHRLPLGQRAGRELREDLEAGGGRRSHLPNDRRGKVGDRQLHR